MKEQILITGTNMEELRVKELLEVDGGNSVQAEDIFQKLRDMIAVFFGGNKED